VCCHIGNTSGQCFFSSQWITPSFICTHLKVNHVPIHSLNVQSQSSPPSIHFLKFQLPACLNFLQIHLNAGQVFKRRMSHDKTMVASSTMDIGSTQHGWPNATCPSVTAIQENYFLVPCSWSHCLSPSYFSSHKCDLFISLILFWCFHEHLSLFSVHFKESKKLAIIISNEKAWLVKQVHFKLYTSTNANSSTTVKNWDRCLHGSNLLHSLPFFSYFQVFSCTQVCKGLLNAKCCETSCCILIPTLFHHLRHHMKSL